MQLPLDPREHLLPLISAGISSISQSLSGPRLSSCTPGAPSSGTHHPASVQPEKWGQGLTCGQDKSQCRPFPKILGLKHRQLSSDGQGSVQRLEIKQPLCLQPSSLQLSQVKHSCFIGEDKLPGNIKDLTSVPRWGQLCWSPPSSGQVPLSPLACLVSQRCAEKLGAHWDSGGFK